jgi:hypothetical protein
MSWLSTIIKKVRGTDKPNPLPPLSLPTIAGGLARPIGTLVNNGLTNIGNGQSVAQAFGNAAKEQADKAADSVTSAANIAREALTAKKAIDGFLHGPVVWIVVGLALAVLFSRRRG